MSGLACAREGCTNTGVLPADPDDPAAGYICFEHAGIATDAPAEPAPEPEVPAFHVDLTNNFAAMLLELAAVQMTPDEGMVQGAYEALATNTGLQVDVCAGIMLAMSMVTTLGAMTAEDVLGLADAVKQVAADAEWADMDPPPAAGEVHPAAAGPGSDGMSGDGPGAADICPECDGQGLVESLTEPDAFDTCPNCAGTGYLAEPAGPTIFDALAALDDEPLNLPESDPDSVHATPDEGKDSE